MVSPATGHQEQDSAIIYWQDAGRNYRRLALLALVLNAISALMFIFSSHRAVYDDPNNFPDVQRYVSEGVSVNTIRHHQNPTGPTSFIWMAAGVRILGGDGLRDARLASLLSWVILGASVLFLGGRGSYAGLWYAAFLVTLAFPHAVSASALVLTEGPALLFALLGVLAWLEAFSRPAISLRLGLLGILGGFSLGMAITCRQYFLALLPAALFFAIFQIRRNKATRN
jgi:4-amino-4-deoxy-L-arabinose transferase-like glycosyltransferase